MTKALVLNDDQIEVLTDILQREVDYCKDMCREPQSLPDLKRYVHHLDVSVAILHVFDPMTQD
mgnify:CR=1 FL=1